MIVKDWHSAPYSDTFKPRKLVFKSVYLKSLMVFNGFYTFLLAYHQKDRKKLID